MFESIDSVGSQAIIRVIGIGGCGGNVVNYLAEAGIVGVDYAYIDVEDEIMALISSCAESKCPFPKNVADALAGRSEIDEATLQYWLDNIAAVIEGADMIFIIAGMGGNTGSAIAPAVAKLARDKDILTMAFAVVPFWDEGKYRRVIEHSLDSLYKQVDSLAAIPNQREFEYIGSNATSAEIFLGANDSLKHSIQGIAELINISGAICVDFADIKTVTSRSGWALTTTAAATGKKRARKAVGKALYGHWLNGTKMHTASGLIVNVRSGADLTIGEFSTVAEAVHECAGDDTIVVIGSTTDDEFTQGEIRVTVVATGLG